jgi:hypothetical protein
VTKFSITVTRVRERIGEPDTFDISFDGGGQPLELTDWPVNKPIQGFAPNADLLAALKAVLCILAEGPLLEQVQAAITKAEAQP